MRPLNLFVVSTAFALLWSCTKEPAAPVNGGLEDGPAASDSYVDEGVEPGWIRIRLGANAKELRTGVFTRTPVESGNEEVDEVARLLGATEIKRVFAEGGKYASRRRLAGLHLWYDIKIDEELSLTRAQSEFSGVSGVEHVQPVYKMRFAYETPPLREEFLYTPVRMVLDDGNAPVNDPELFRQWHYHNDGSVRGARAGADIGLFDAWEKFNAGSPEVVVAVFDMGVQYDHPDLAANMWINEAELNGSAGVDDDGNGYVDDVYGYNFVKNTGAIEPGGHGTHCAGTIAAVNNNGIGVAGVAGGTGTGDGARIMSCQLEPGSPAAPFLDAFAYAADNGAVITSNSWVLDMDSMPEDVAAAIDYFNRYAGTDGNGVQTGPMKGGVCLFAAGNYQGSGPLYEGRIWYPAADDRVIGVASMGADYRKAHYSQYGQGTDIMAPGGDTEEGEDCAVYSTLTEDGYGYMCGTSMATPHAAGVAALMVAQYGGEGFDAEELRRILLSSYRNVGEYQEEAYRNDIGAGLLDASMMDSYFRNPGEAPDALGEPAVEGVPDGLTLSCKVPADRNGDAAAWLHLSYAPAEAPAEMVDSKFSFNVAPGGEFFRSFKLKGDTEYDVTMKAEDRYGNLSEPFSARVRTLPHINRPPAVKTSFPNVVIQQVEADKSRSFDIARHFTDPDTGEFGDRVTYSIVSNGNDRAVKISLEGGERLVAVPTDIGSSRVTVRATDLAGEYAETSFTISVIHKSFADVEIQKAGRDNTVKVPLADHFFEPEGSSFTYKASSSAPNTLSVNLNDGILSLVPVKGGEVSVSVTVETGLGPVISARFPVRISEDEDGEPLQPQCDEITVYPNPVAARLNIILPGASGKAEARIYDAAARMVLSGAVTFSGSGEGGMDVSALAPGSYSMVLETAGGRITAPFMKR